MILNFNKNTFKEQKKLMNKILVKLNHNTNNNILIFYLIRNQISKWKKDKNIVENRRKMINKVIMNKKIKKIKNKKIMRMLKKMKIKKSKNKLIKKKKRKIKNKKLQKNKN